MNDSLFKAILSLDSYNRGYDAGINLVGNYIGNAHLIDESVSLDTLTETGRDQAIGFFAQAYEIDLGGGNSEINISYRGTNTWLEPITGCTLPSLLDMWNGWRLGNAPTDPNSLIELFGVAYAGSLANDTDAAQGMMAVEFYKYIVDTYSTSEAYRENSEITVTGHSLGGGLAGFVSTLYGLGDNGSRTAATIFDTMTYDKSAELASSFRVMWHDLSGSYESLLTPYELSQFEQIPSVVIDDVQVYDSDLHSLVYGNSQAWDNDKSGIEGYILEGEVLDNPLLGRTGDDEKYKFDLGFTEEDYGLIDTELHSMATLVIRMFADESEVNGDYWKEVAQYFWPVMYDQSFAQEIGMDHASLLGKNQDDGDYAAVLRTIVAYSAINEGTRVFGDTGIRAFYDDANEFGQALNASGASNTLTEYATDISKAFIQYAGLLAASHVTSALFSDALEGVIDYDQTSNPDVFIVNFKSNDWTPISSELKYKMQGIRNDVVEHIFSDFIQSHSIDIGSFIVNNDWLGPGPFLSSGGAFNRVIFAALDSGSTEYNLEEVGEAFKGTLYVGSIGNDIVTMQMGSSDRNVFLGNGGTDSYIGGDSLDIAIGGSGQDTFDGGGSADFLYGGGDIDVLVGGLSSDIVIGGTGNDIFVADIDGEDVYHGGYDEADLANAWYYDPFDIEDIARAADGTDTISYLDLTGVYFDITVLDAALGNYWVDKYYGNSVFNGPSDRDALFSIETIQVAAGAARQVGGTAVHGTGGNDVNLHYNYHGGYNVAHNYYGYAGVEIITGGFKNDFLDGGTGDDDLSGNKGNDTYFYRLGDGQDLIKDLGTQGDIDVLMFDASINASEVELGYYNSSNMKITFADDTYIVVYAQNSPYGIDYIKFADGAYWDMQGTLVTVYGTEANDSLHGTNDSTYREGSLIHDVIYAYGGNDYVNGDTGNDQIFAGSGNDTVIGDYGNDTIYGGDNDDTLNGGYNDDILYGGAGVDSLFGGNDAGNDILYGDAGDDTLSGHAGQDTLYGGSGLDTMTGGTGSDIFRFRADTAFQNIDKVMDFKLTENDVIDISDVLDGFYDYGVDVITDFVQIVAAGANSLLSVDQDGGANNFIQIATLYSITGLADEAALEASGRLVTV